MKTYCIIPARLDSKRLENKLLLKSPEGLPVLSYPYRQAMACKSIDEVIIAADEKMMDGWDLDGVPAENNGCLGDFECLVVSTPSSINSGTNRIANAIGHLQGLPTSNSHHREFEDTDIIINLQGDEVDFDAANLEELIRVKKDTIETREDIVTMATPFTNYGDYLIPDNVKVVFSKSGRALYFSRAGIPHQTINQFYAGFDVGYKHIGVYAYTIESLNKFCSLYSSDLETLESLEQLRALEHDMTIRVVKASPPVGSPKEWPRSIDTRGDYDRWINDPVWAS
jgi:3-deoxy-manno-octulosonate cytidylyltransferase (CMP-KDO synthetase)